VRNLPDDSATARARRDGRPTLDLLFLRRIEYWTHLAFWARTKAGEQNRDRPVLVPLRGDGAAKRRDGLGLDERLARQNERRAARQALLEGRPAPTADTREA